MSADRAADGAPPHAWAPRWRQAQARNAANFAPDAAGAFPLHSCSVGGHGGAAAFRTFIAPVLAGRVLDVGCGPQPLPAYLEGYPLALITGLDPLPPAAAPHPFAFHLGGAEQVPWAAGAFQTVLAATSLDHVLDPLAVLDEITRVLAPGGHFLCWASIWPDAPAYDPRHPPAQLADDCHAFHLGPWFLDACAARFRLERRGEGPGRGHFFDYAQVGRPA